jgi:hypothetical protein
MKRLVEFPSDSGEPILVEVEDVGLSGETRRGLSASAVIERAQTSFEDALEKARPMATSLVGKLRAIGDAAGFDHKPSDNLDLLNVPQRVDHHHVEQYEAPASHRVLLGPTLPYGHLGDFGWHRTRNRNRRKRREPTQLCSIAEQSSREPVSELALWVVLLYEVKKAYEFVTMQPRHVFPAETFAVFP